MFGENFILLGLNEGKNPKNRGILSVYNHCWSSSESEQSLYIFAQNLTLDFA